MKITNIIIKQLEGIMDHPGPFWEERRIRPLDIYPQYRCEGVEGYETNPAPLGDGRYKVTGQFVEIQTDEGLTGVAGPLFYPSTAFYLDTFIKKNLVGQDPLRTEYLWDILYRANVNARSSEVLAALSMADIALWDLKGKFYGQPVCNLLGGPTRDKIPCYASALCCSIQPESVEARVKSFLADGYTAAKFFVRDGPQDGPAGMARNLELIKTARAAGGPDFKIMLDVWCSWDVDYTLKMAKLMTEYEPEWFEEPVLPDMRTNLADLTARCPVKIAGGEHEYTRWGAQLLMEMKALSVYQFDVIWAGGISEMMKIATLCSVNGAPLIPHGISMQATAHLAFALSPAVIPILENLFVQQERLQFFLKNKVLPQDGYVTLPRTPGLGMDFDESSIQDQKQISYS